jgi:proline iminopeptidase
MVSLYPVVAAFDGGMLEVGDGQKLHWEIAGAREGLSAVVLHGGPGQGSSPQMRRGFDPERYRVVTYDQRGAGASTPHVSEDGVDLTVNTTEHLIADLERLRAHLRIERWLVSGGSWGTTLALAYAQRHPERVIALVLSAVTAGRPSERAWLYHGARRFFPEAFEAFAAGAGRAVDPGALPAAYAELLGSRDRTIRLAAARAWCDWEDAVLSLEVEGYGAGQPVYASTDERERLAVATLCAHYVSNDWFLRPDQLLEDMPKIAHIPGVLIHGRMDLSAPVETAWALARRWPAGRLVVIDRAGHRGHPERRRALLEALDSFASGRR